MRTFDKTTRTPRISRAMNAWIVAVACACALGTRADTGYLIEMMDISNEAGPRPARTGATHTCGKIHWRSLNVETPSRVTIPLGGAAKSFTAAAGIADSSKVDPGAHFRVLAPDGKVLWEKADVRKGKEHPMWVSMAGLDSVILEVQGAQGISAAWAEACFQFEDGKYPPNDVRMNSPQLGILTPPERPEPRINGATVYGVRPGRPILFHVPVTGKKPLKVEVEGLPEGTSFDPATRNITGCIAKEGEYRLVFRASNAEGRAERAFTIKVGETISLTPAMGWNSWNCFGGDVSAKKVMAAADAMVTNGLIEHGWTYINIDDFWQNRPGSKDPTLLGPERNPDGTINPNARFPDMKGLADYIHAKGLKAGLYSSPGPKTCGGCTGSYLHEEQDAKSYADWGFDFLKHDWCSYSEVAAGSGLQRAMLPYLVMGRALRAQKRDIILSLCQYGMDNVSAWGAKVGGQSWRTTGDVFDTWRSISGSIARQKQLWYYSAPGAWNDPDMLCVGRMRWNGFKDSRLAPNEQYTHISLWALVASPLMIGCDLTRLDPFTLSLLTNDEVIEIDQDPLGKGAACIVETPDHEIWARPLADGSIAAGLYNKGLKEREIAFDIAAAGLAGKWNVRDCWRQKDEGAFKGTYSRSVPGHATHLVRLTPGVGAWLRTRDVRDNAWMNEMRAYREVPQ